ncbi:MAG: RidA family protein [Thermodesulfovibrionales bacterium]
MSPEDKLKELGIELLEASSPLGSYIPFIKIGDLVFLSGILPLINGRLTRQGKVGKEVSLEEAREDARVVTVNALSILKTHLGNLNKIKRCIKVTGYIASDPDFTEQPKVLDAASDLLFEIFGEKGRHVRSAIGVSVLPLNSPIEIEFIFEVSQ